MINVKLVVNSFTEIESKIIPNAFWKMQITPGERSFSNFFEDLRAKYTITTFAIIANKMLKSEY